MHNPCLFALSFADLRIRTFVETQARHIDRSGLPTLHHLRHLHRITTTVVLTMAMVMLGSLTALLSRPLNSAGINNLFSNALHSLNTVAFQAVMVLLKALHKVLQGLQIKVPTVLLALVSLSNHRHLLLVQLRRFNASTESAGCLLQLLHQEALPARASSNGYGVWRHGCG
jgi:hypothetical protein